MATTRLEERLWASLGQLQAAPIRFEAVQDAPGGGVLCAWPALLVLGLLRHSSQNFSLPPGYYPLDTIFLVIALLALARVQSLEALRYEPPGEWGKLVGLDRIPEVRTLREEIRMLCENEQTVRDWSGALAREWMEAEPESAGTLHVDGHTRVYHGQLTELPRRYVARQRLCLRGTTDYWVNAMDGQPFFVVSQAADPGLLKVLEEQIVPRLLQEVPRQPTAEELAADPRRCRFTLIFDRARLCARFFRADVGLADRGHHLPQISGGPVGGGGIQRAQSHIDQWGGSGAVPGGTRGLFEEWILDAGTAAAGGERASGFDAFE